MKLGFIGTGAITSTIDYVATVVQGLANMAVSQPQRSFTELAGEFATGGGINEQVVAHLKNTGALAAVSDALNAVLQRMKAAP